MSINAQVNNLIVKSLLTTVNAERVQELVMRMFDDANRMRVSMYLNGTVEIPEFTQKKLSNRDNTLCTFCDYDIFTDLVKCSYEETVTRWFNSEEKAQTWATEKDPYKYAGEREETENCKYSATRVFTVYTTMDSESWENQKDVE